MKRTWWLFLLFLSVWAYAYAGGGHSRGSGFNEGVLEMSDYPILFDESDDDPGIPLSDRIQLYAKDKTGTTTLYTQDASGTVKEIADSGDLSSYLTSSDAASTYAPIAEPLSLHLDQTTPQTITATDTTITASDEIYFGDATDSFKIKKDTIQGILDLTPTPDLSGYFKLDQTPPQTIINGTPKFTKSLIAAKTITDTSLIESFTFGDQAAIFQANGYADYGVIFSAVGDHQYPLYNSFLKSRTLNGITRKAVKTGDQLGLIEFVGDTGTYYVGGAEIRAEVIATPGTNTMPTDLIFGTNFNASVIPERWRLTSIGDWVPKADNQKVYFGASKDASITYNGTNLIINPKEVGSGYLDLKGVIRTTDEDYSLFGDTTGMNATILPLTGRDRLYSAISSDATSGNIRAGFFAGNFRGTSSSSLNVNGMNSFANTLSSSTGDLTATNMGGGLRSRYAIRHDGKGTVALASTITANIQANGGNITKGSLYNAETPSVQVGKTIGDLAGFRVVGGAVAGTITTRYGLKVDSLLGGTTLWGVYVDTDDSFFGGKVAFTQTDGNEYIDSLDDGYMDYGATTAHRFSGPIHAVHKAADGTASVADGTYTVGIGTTTNGTITIKDGIITAIQEAS